jgi:DNA replication protein DnaC
MNRPRRPLAIPDFERMNLPREFWTAKVQHVPEAMREKVNRYLVHLPKMLDRGIGMILSGDTGVGKTGIAALVAKEARSCGYTVFFTTVWELRECVKAKVMFEEATSVLDRCRDVDFLILDGMRPEDAKDFTFDRRSIEELLVTRGARRKVSILTSRMKVRDFQADFPSLIEAVQGCMVFLDVKGPNQRTEKNAELKKTAFGDL